MRSAGLPPAASMARDRTGPNRVPLNPGVTAPSAARISAGDAGPLTRSACSSKAMRTARSAEPIPSIARFASAIASRNRAGAPMLNERSIATMCRRGTAAARDGMNGRANASASRRSAAMRAASSSKSRSRR